MPDRGTKFGGHHDQDERCCASAVDCPDDGCGRGPDRRHLERRSSGSSQFLTQQEQSHFRASKFVGLAIYGQDNQRIGDVNEILIDNTGNAKALVLGVGGFLGIGEKNVAVPFSAVEWVNERPASTAAAGGSAGQNTGAGGANTAMNTSPPAGGSPAPGWARPGRRGPPERVRVA
jgi:sporulation protein YlmC with PRC-barrel domain